jgi:transcriptional regulator with XRE-family HTH domain
MNEKPRRLKKGSPDDWPSLALMEFTMALAKAMAEIGMKQKDLAEALDVSPPYISSVMSGNENLTVEQMSRLAEAAGSSLHLTIAPKGLYIRWVEDTLEEPTTEMPIGPSLHSYEAALSTPREYPMFAPPEATSRYRGVDRPLQDPWEKVAVQNVSRPARPPSFLTSSRSSNSKPLPPRRPVGLLN